VLFIDNRGQELTLSPVFSVSDKSSNSVDYMLVDPDLTHPPYFISISNMTNGTYYKLYGDNQNNIHRFFTPEKGFSRIRSFVIRDDLYTFQERLYKINIKTFSTDSIGLIRNDYESLSLFFTGEETLLVASSFKFVHIYSIDSFDLIHNIEREDERQLDLPRIIDNFFIFQNRSNELAVYDLSDSKIITRFNTGEQPAYFLGIKIGSFDDIISWYRTASINGTIYLYFTTFSGAIYCVNPVTGEVINQIYRFRGKANNAGLISSFEIFDVNRDGMPDIIGASVDNNIYCVDGKSLELLWHYDTGYENQIPLSFYDTDGNGIPEVFGVNDAMILTILSGEDGRILLRKKLGEKIFQTGISLVDLDGNGFLDLVLSLNHDTIQIYQCDQIEIDKNKLIWLSPL
jgi:outer membrane protein assembly factor BamB